jgi:hypothetical protein
MKKIFLLFLLFPVFVFGQGWERTYKIDHSAGYSVQETIDGGYIICGITTTFNDVGWDVYLIKTNNFGDTLWTKTYGGIESDWGRSVKQTLDGGYIITGWTESFGNGDKDVYLIKTDGIGNIIWTQVFGGVNIDKGESVIETNDGGFVILGETTSYGNGIWDIYLIKTDHNGDTLWTKTFGGEFSEFGKSVQQTTDGGFIITGSTDTYGFGGVDVYLIKTDVDGNTLWNKTFGSDQDEYGQSVKQTSDGGYIIAGFTYSIEDDVYLLKTDENGLLLWTKTYGGESMDWGYSVQQTIDNGYIVAGVTNSYGNGDKDVYLVKTNSIGDTLWSKAFGDIDIDFGHSVQQTSDLGYIITGVSTSFENGDTFVYLIKTDEDGIVTFTSEIPIPKHNRKLIKTIDLLGKEIQPRENIPYIEVYDDGSTEKKVIVK